ncbi:LCP family protein [Yinghuangia seranimata]|uniref:LCP family protein n=1 Tax=Yinghuangia seranimata TaxID=408067 RepID=UPI00248B8D24|nr:LCP family protein [Yinghuangia seranimata]MDI2125108.1 LCP family protein [Yinghuangia seranimata]
MGTAADGAQGAAYIDAAYADVRADAGDDMDAGSDTGTDAGTDPRPDTDAPQPGGSPRRRGRRRAGREAVPGKRRRRWVKPLVITLSLLLVLIGGVAGFAWYTIRQLDKNITRVDNALSREGLAPDAGPRPVADPAAGKAMNILLVGSDSRGPAATGSDSGGDIETSRGDRTDTMMVLHIPSDRSAVRAVSLPRDSWVPIPGHGEAKLNAAFSWGGPQLLVATVENLTNIRIDHYVAIDFNGFKSMVDTLGGVEVTLKQASHDPSQNVDFAAGTNKLNGARALQFVRQRHGLPRGDFDRIVRQQQLLGAIASKVTREGILTHPLRTKDLLDSLTRSMTADKGFSVTDMLGLADSLKGIGDNDLEFRTVPTTGTGWREKQSVVLLDDARDRELFAAIRADTAWPTAPKSETWKP